MPKEKQEEGEEVEGKKRKEKEKKNQINKKSPLPILQTPTKQCESDISLRQPNKTAVSLIVYRYHSVFPTFEIYDTAMFV